MSTFAELFAESLKSIQTTTVDSGHINIDFGKVKEYFSDKGFGFVTHTFLSGRQSETFFHIKNIKRTCPDLAQKLDNKDLVDTIYFWYETANTSKGEQVCRVLQSNAVHNMIAENLPFFVNKIENIWKNIDSTLPIWLHDVTVDLVGNDRVNELSLERDTLERERRELEEERRKEQEALRKIEETKQQKLVKEQKNQEDIEEKEFEQLVAEMRSLGITESREVSWHIMNNRLGDKYKNISGVVEMEQDGTSWNFKGGFPPDIYARLCRELGLSNQGTRARAVGFKPFKDL